MKERRHHNNKGERQVRRGKTYGQVKRIARKLGVDSRVLLKCSRAGCPRTKRVPRDRSDPVGTAIVQFACPWHARSGDKDEGVRYFDAAGKEIEVEIR